MYTPIGLVLLAFSCCATLAESFNVKTEPEYVPDVYMVQLHDAIALGRRSGDHTHVAFAKRALEKSIPYEVRFSFVDTDLFYGLSLKLLNNDSVGAMQALPEVANM